MTRLEHLREYRGRLLNEETARIDKFYAEGRPQKDAKALATFLFHVVERTRLIDAEVDKLMEAERLFGYQCQVAHA